MKKNPTTFRDNNDNLSTLAQLEGITAQQSPYQDDDWSYIEGCFDLIDEDDEESSCSDVTPTIQDDKISDPMVLPHEQDETSLIPPNTSSNQPITSPPPTSGYNLFPPNEMSYLRILSYCDDHGCPLYFFDGLMKLLWEETKENRLNLSQKVPRRETLFRRISKVCMAPPPITEIVALENATNRNGANQLHYERLPRDVAVLFRYDFSLQIMDLLSDSAIFGSLDKLDVNKGPNSDRFGMFRRDEPHSVFEVNSGQWYKHAYSHLIKDPENEFLMPLIFYVDKTGTDSLQRHGVEPLMFTTSIINLKQRQSTRSWRVLCYIPELKGKSSAQSQMDNTKLFGKHQRDYHKVVEKALESLVTVQNNVVKAWIRLGDQLKQVRLFFPVAMIVNDGKSADMLTNRYGTYQRCGRISHACDVSPENCASNYFSCSYLLQSDVDKLQALALGPAVEEGEELLAAPSSRSAMRNRGVIQSSTTEAKLQQDAESKLRLISAHAVRNAFRNVCFGGDPRGIYGATPTDLMHAFNEGVLKYCMKEIFERIPPSKKARLDDVVDKVFRNQRSSLRNVFPRTNFVKGFSNLTLITASEWVGVCFTTFILSMLEQGQNILLPILNGYGDAKADYIGDIEALSDEEEGSDSDSTDASDNNQTKQNMKGVQKRLPCTLVELQQLLQALLCFHAWAKRSSSFDCSKNGIKRMKYAIQIMLNQIKRYLPRVTGMGWNIQKFHDITHLPEDICRFGSPQNTDAGSGERSLKYFAKEVASTSQKREGKFLGQVAKRLHQKATILRAKRITDPIYEWEPLGDGKEAIQDKTYKNGLADFSGNASVNPTPCLSSTKARYIILFDTNGDYQGTKWNGSEKSNGHMEIHPLIIQWFINNQREQLFRMPVLCWTEYTNHYGNRLRAHPNFRSDGPWYDWANVLFGEGEDDEQSVLESQFYPSKILCFYIDPVSGESCALVHTCHEREDPDYAPICDEWFLEYVEEVVTVASEEQLPNGSMQSKRRKERHLFPVIRSVSVHSLAEPLFVIQEIPGVHESFVKSETTKYHNRCIVVKNREESWANEFC
jgi:hypothetical protein